MKSPYLYMARCSEQDWLLMRPIQNAHQLPKIAKIVYHLTSRLTVQDKRYLAAQAATLTLITGQIGTSIPVKTQVAAFQLRKGVWIGTQVTVRPPATYSLVSTWIDAVAPSLERWKGKCPESVIVWPEIETNFEKFLTLTGIDLSMKVSPPHETAWLQFLSVPLDTQHQP